MHKLVWAGLALSVLAFASRATAADTVSEGPATPAAAAAAAAPAADKPPPNGTTPSVTLTTSATHNDNILASDTHPVGDMTYVVNPEFKLTTHYNNLDVVAYGQVTLTRDGSHSSEDSNDYEVGGHGALKIGDDGKVFIDGDWSKETEGRSVKNTSRASVNRIVDYTDAVQAGAVGTIAGVQFTAKGTVHQFDFQNGVSASGATILQNDRDRNDWFESIKAEVNPGGKASFYLKVVLKQIDYRLAPPKSHHNRDSHGYDLLAGATFNFSGTLTGDVSAGYTRRLFPDPRLPDVKDVALNGSVTWKPNKHNSVAATLSRSLQEDVEPNSSGYIATTLGLTLTHDLSDKFTATGTASHEWDSHKGIDRGDRIGGLGASLVYHVTDHVDLTGSYNYTVQTSSGALAKDGYRENVVAATLAINY